MLLSVNSFVVNAADSDILLLRSSYVTDKLRKMIPCLRKENKNNVLQNASYGYNYGSMRQNDDQHHGLHLE